MLATNRPRNRPRPHVSSGAVTLTDVRGQRSWDSLLQELGDGHPLQLWAWGEVKRLNGWTPHRLVLT